MENPTEKRPSHSSFSASSTSPRDAHLASKLRALAAVDGARLAATALALLMGMTVLGVSGNTLAVYDHTKLPATPAGSVSALPGLWPSEFNMRPTVSLVAGSVFVVLAGVAGLVGGKVEAVSFAFFSLQYGMFLLMNWGTGPRQQDGAHVDVAGRAGGGADRGAGGRRLLLRGQCVGRGGHVLVVDVPVEGGADGDAAAVGHAVRAELDGRVYGGVADSGRGGGAGDGGLVSEGREGGG